MLTLGRTEQDALSTGLAFAWLLRAHFPEFYTMHVATLRTTYRNLLGAAGAFLSLAHQRLLAIETSAMGGVPLKPSDPTEALRHCLAEGTARSYLADQAQAWLKHPIPRAYGLGIEDVEPPPHYYPPPAVEKGVLALALWRLTSNTPWGRVAGWRAQHEVIARIADATLRRQVEEIVPLPKATPLAALCARLDADRPCGVGQLGTILAYVCGRTGNVYADHTRRELRDPRQELINLDWYLTAEIFAHERANQQAAAKWSNAYVRLDGRLVKTPELLGELTVAIARTAHDLIRSDEIGPGRTAPYDPRALIHRFANRGNDEPEIEAAPHDGAAALAAAAAAPVPA